MKKRSITRDVLIIYDLPEELVSKKVLSRRGYPLNQQKAHYLSTTMS